MRKLNLHTHTEYSDGSSSIIDLVTFAINSNHVKLVITDHCYYFSGKQNKGSFEKQREEIIDINNKMGEEYIIQGIEADTKCGYEEILIIGNDACKTWLANKSGKSGEERLDILTRIKHYHECAFVLCHPVMEGCWGNLTSREKYLADELYQLCDAYEIINREKHFIREQEWLRQIIPGKRELIGYDEHGHHSYRDDWPTNEILDNIVINNELDIIKWIKDTNLGN